MTSQEVIKMLQDSGLETKSKIIKDLIKDQEPIRNRTLRLYKQYNGNADIKNRLFDDPNKVNNRLNNDYAGDIIDGITGYMFGEEINYLLDKNKYKESDYVKITEAIKKFNLTNSIDDMDSSTGELMSICGYAARLLYIDKNGQERIMNIKPWEVIFINDPTIDEVQYAMIYYNIDLIQNNRKVTRTKVEWYDKNDITYYIQNDSDNYVFDDSAPVNPQPHLFDYVPVIKFINNNAEMGDFEKVGENINAYDRLLSDIQNEVEEFRLAYLAFYGVEPTAEIIRAARQTGAFHFPEGTDGKFITKPLDSATGFIENQKKTLNENIYKFAKAVDMRDENFSGAAISGESRKWKLVQFENRAKSKERKFIKALREQFKILATSFGKRELKFNYEDLTFQFTRNLPVDIDYQAGATQKLKGNVSDKTRLSLLPFISDPEQELKQMEEEAGEPINFNENNGDGN